MSGVVSGCGETAKASLPTYGRITKAEAITYANEVNLRPADVPEMVSIGVEAEHKDASSVIETTCGIQESHYHVADVKSPTFRSGGKGGGVPLQLVSSDVEVMPTVALADRKLAQIQADIRSPRARACLERAYGQIFAKQLTKGHAHFTLGQTTVSVLRATVPRSFGLGVVIPFALTANGSTVNTRLYVDGYGFVAGRAGVVLTTIRFTYPAPPATEQHLLAVLHSRA